MLVLFRFMGGWLKATVHSKWQGSKMHLLVQVIQNYPSQTHEIVSEVNLLAVFPDVRHKNKMGLNTSLRGVCMSGT